jgi:protein-S-isoprenylcysteine O-methyltransferase Ste14
VTSTATTAAPSGAALIGLTAIAFFVVDAVATKIASGSWQLLPKISRDDRGTYLAIQLTLLAAVILAVWGVRRPGGALPGPSWIWVAAGLLIAWAGIVLRGWSLLTMGTEFRRTLVEGGDRRLVTGGPFRVVRHPSYTGLLLALGGIGLALDDGVALLALAILPAIGIVIRIRAEEPQLRRTFGTAYESFAEGKARLVPRIW